MTRAILLALALALLAASPAGAEQRLVKIRTPSVNVDPGDVVFNGPAGPAKTGQTLEANVLLPDGYDGRRRYPVMYLLHGVGDSFETWDVKGDVRNIAKGFEGIIIMPEGARGFYVDWWNDGRRGAPAWERFYLDELIPQVEREFRVRPGRRWHAIAGLSMGGHGAAYLASQLPGYFGSLITFSGFLDHASAFVQTGFQYVVPEASYQQIFGEYDRFWAIGHDPTRIAANLAQTRIYVTKGDGTPEPEANDSPSAIAVGGPAEAAIISPMVEAFVAATREAGAAVTYVPRRGVHEWSYYWRRALREAIAWNPFAPVAEASDTWTYQTTARHGDAWGLHYEFAEPPEAIQTLQRDGDRLRATGSPGTLTVTTAPGCRATIAVPGTTKAPPAICGRLTLDVRRSRTTLRVRVRRRAGGRSYAAANAVVRVAGRRKRTNAAGRVTFRLRTAARRITVRATLAGLPSVTRVITPCRAGRSGARSPCRGAAG